MARSSGSLDPQSTPRNAGLLSFQKVFFSLFKNGKYFFSVEPNRHRWRHPPKGPKLARAPQQEVDPGQGPLHLFCLETELKNSLSLQKISMKPSSLQTFYFSVTNQFLIKDLLKPSLL